MANGRALWTPPVFTPLQYGLLSAAADRTLEAPAHWSAGVTWQSHCPQAGTTYDPCLTDVRDLSGEPVGSGPDEPIDKEPTTEFFLRGATPFIVYARFDCSPLGFQERAQALAQEALTRAEAHQVEYAFATGRTESAAGDTIGVYPHLQSDVGIVDDSGATLQTTADVLTETPQSLVAAVGMLENALGDCYHGVGVIHAPAELSVEVSRYAIGTARASVITTLLGNRLSIGTGYPGAAPDGVVEFDDVFWIYATGAVFYARSAIQVLNVTDSFDRAKNTIEALAERTYVLGWDCCHFAVPVLAERSEP